MNKNECGSVMESGYRMRFSIFRMGSRSERKCDDESVLSMLTFLLYKIEEFILMAFLLL